MSVFHKTMVWLGLVDDDEYYADENEYYADEYGEPVQNAAPRTQSTRATATATAPAPPEQSQVTVIRPRKREEPVEAAPVAAKPRPTAVTPIPMPASVIRSVSASTWRRTCRPVAPSAMRTPISAVRWLTPYETTP